MSYTIKIFYRTGDSFGSHDEVECIGAAFKDIEMARKALIAIKEHHQFVTMVDGYSFGKDYPTPEDKKDFYENLSSQSWFVEDEHTEYDKNEWDHFNNLIHSYEWQHCLMMEIEPDVFKKIHAFWVGYFESIHSAEIQVNTDTKELWRVDF